MKVFVTGVNGQLGHDVINELIQRGIEGIGSDIAAFYNVVEDDSILTTAPYVPLDITNTEAVEHVISKIHPDVVIHCAAWTAVDDAEEEENVLAVRQINALGTGNIANVCKKIDSKMVYISTDYVFDGKGKEPWKPDCKEFHPLNVYGQTKLEGEVAVENALEKFFIVRISWLFGKNGSNFIKTILNIAKKYDQIRVVDDQIGTPTYSFDLAGLLVDMIETEKYGYYHATNEGGYISWFDFACEILRQATATGHLEYARKGFHVMPVTTEEYGDFKAARPFNSRLDKSKLAENGFHPLPDWKDAVYRFLLSEQVFEEE